MELNAIYLVDNTTPTPQEKGSVHFYLLGIGNVLLLNACSFQTFKKKLLTLVLIREGGHHIIMEYGWIRINSVKFFQNNNKEL